VTGRTFQANHYRTGVTDPEVHLRQQLVEFARRLTALGLVTGTSGNLSGRSPIAPRFLVTPSGIDYDSMTPDQVVPVDGEGAPLGRSMTPSVDTPNHLAIYRARADVSAVVHTHSPYATAFSTLREPIPPLVLEPAGYLGGEVRVMDYHSPSSSAVAGALVAGLGGDRALLMPNHGVIAVGEDAAKAFHAAVAVEEAARIAWLVRQIGQPRPLPDGDIQWMREFVHRRYGQR
jgi:ribulose-5-phosphate 4-epimerase/fuculose-1-phosphate aldolase